MLEIIKAHAVNNLCYKASQKMIPKGIVVHSTGVNNPNLKRYVDSPSEVGKNLNGNHWNVAKPGGREVCVHAFIGYDDKNQVRVAEILPLNICCWGVGNGSKGSYNYDPAYIQFEICEDGLTDKEYYKKAFALAAQYCAELCRKYGIEVEKIVGHCEAYKRGYGSNHSDPEHWMKKFGETMDDFRKQVSVILSAKEVKKENALKENVITVVCKDDLVSISSNAVYYSGKEIPEWVKSKRWYVKSEPRGERVVIDKSEDGTSSICSPIHKKYLTVVKPNEVAVKREQPSNNSPYLIKVTASLLNIRKGPSVNTSVVGTIKDKGVYTIVQEKNGQGASKWGKLKSGAGWISLDYVKKV